MKTRSKVLALLLSVAMTFTSFTVPAMAEEAVVEDVAIEAVEEEEAVEALAAEETVAEDAEETVAKAAAEEEVAGTIGNVANNDTLLLVHSIEELEEAVAAAPSGKQITIDVRSIYDMPKDNDYAVSKDYTLNVAAGADVVLNMNGRSIVFEQSGMNGETPFTLTPDEYKALKGTINIPSGASLTINGVNTLNAAIVNEGTLKVNGGTFSAKNGVTLTNKGTAYIENGTFNTVNKNISTIVNEGTLVLDYANVKSAGTSTTTDLAPGYTAEQAAALKNNVVYTVNNSGSLLVESATIEAGSGDGDEFALLNTKTLDIRGAYSVASIINKGAEAVAVQGTENSQTNTASVGRVYTVEGASYTQHDGYIGAVYMAADTKFENVIASGNFTQVGGSVGTIIYSAETLPTLNVGQVNRLYCVEQKGEKQVGSAKPDSYKFNTFNGSDVVTVDAFKMDAEKYKEKFSYVAPNATEVQKLDYVTVDGENVEGQLSNYVKDGVAYIDNEPIVKVEAPVKNRKAEKIVSLSDLQAKAAQGGTYYLDITTKDADGNITYPKDSEGNTVRNIVVESPITVAADFTLISKSDADDSYEYLVIKGNGGFVVNEGVVFENDVYLDAENNTKEKPQTATIITNNGTVKNYGTIDVAYATVPVVVNNGVMRQYSEIRANNSSAVAVSNAQSGTYEQYYNITANSAKAGAVDNAGTFISKAQISVTANGEYNTESSTTVYEKNLVAVNNAGTFTASGNISVNNSENGIAVKNAGTYTMNNGTINMSTAKTTAVSNDGSFTMAGGTINAYTGSQLEDVKNSYAIIYSGENAPVLIDGIVTGSRGTSYSKNRFAYKVTENGAETTKYTGVLDETNPAYGSAVINFNSEFTTGSFKNSDNTTVDSANAARINGGIIDNTTRIHLDTAYTYMLMEVGESLVTDNYAADVLGVSGYPFTLGMSNNTFGVAPSKLFTYSVTGTGVSVKTIKASEYDPELYGEGKAEASKKDEEVQVISADAPGNATVKVTNTIDGTCEYINVDVVAKDGRAKIVAENYTARLVQPKMNINAYSKSNEVEVYWELNTAVTGAYNIADSFKPVKLIVSGKSAEGNTDFYKYFSVSDAITKATFTKRYYFDLDTEATAGWQSTKLVQDGITKLEPVNVTLLVENTASGKTLEVPVADALEITVNQTKPSVKFKKLTVNSAYTQNAYYTAKYFPYNYDDDDDDDGDGDGIDIYPAALNGEQYNYAAITAFGNVNYEDDITITAADSKDFHVNGDKLEYVGSSKGGSYKVPVSVEFADYYGTYDAVLPVSVKAVYPKIALTKTSKNVVVPATAADYNNIPVYLESKDPAAIGTIENVEIDGESSFEVVENFSGNNDVRKTGKTYYAQNTITLKPRKDLTAPEKVKLKVTYRELKANKGKKYSTNVVVSVKPVDRSKFKILKPIVRGMLYPAKNAVPLTDAAGNSVDVYTLRSANVSFDTNPDNFTDGYFVAESADGKSIVSNVGIHDTKSGMGDVHFGGRTARYSFNVYAAAGLTEADKFVNVKISWFDSKNQKLGKEALVKVPVNWNPATVDEIKPVTINTNLPLNLSPELKDNTHEKMAKVAAVKSANGVRFDGETGVIAGPANLFTFASVAGKLDAVSGIKVTPVLDALRVGKIVPGATYKYTLRFTTPQGEYIDKALDVKIADVKSVKAINMTQDVGLSALAGYSRAYIELGTEKPYYSLKVAKVELDAASAAKFEISRYTNWYDDYATHITDSAENVVTNWMYNRDEKLDQYIYGPVVEYDNDSPYTRETFALSYKDNTVPSGLKAKEKVTLNITYNNGATAKVTVPVTIVGLGKAK